MLSPKLPDNRAYKFILILFIKSTRNAKSKRFAFLFIRHVHTVTNCLETSGRLCRTELELEGLLSPEDLRDQWEQNFRDMSPRLLKCDGAEALTRRLKDMGIPQVR